MISLETSNHQPPIGCHLSSKSKRVSKYLVTILQFLQWCFHFRRNVPYERWPSQQQHHHTLNSPPVQSQELWGKRHPPRNTPPLSHPHHPMGTVFTPQNYSNQTSRSSARIGSVMCSRNKGVVVWTGSLRNSRVPLSNVQMVVYGSAIKPARL